MNAVFWWRLATIGCCCIFGFVVWWRGLPTTDHDYYGWYP